MPKYFTKENAAEKGHKGGIRSGEVRRQKAELRDVAKTLMKMSLKKGAMEDFDNLEEAEGKNMTSAEAIFISQMIKAIEGDKQAAEFCFKYAGLEPDKNINVNAEVNETNDEINNILNILTEYNEKGEKYSGKNKKKDE